LNAAERVTQRRHKNFFFLQRFSIPPRCTAYIWQLRRKTSQPWCECNNKKEGPTKWRWWWFFLCRCIENHLSRSLLVKSCEYIVKKIWPHLKQMVGL